MDHQNWIWIHMSGKTRSSFVVVGPI